MWKRPAGSQARRAGPRQTTGEAAVQAAFPGSIIVRPAVMFAPDDSFLTRILELLRMLPAYPMFGAGRAELQPAYADDVAEAISRVFGRTRRRIVSTSSRPASLFVRGAAADHRPWGGIAAGTDAD